MPDNDASKNKLVPNYKNKCDLCDQSPTVTVEKDGKFISDYDMCGPCTLGESSAIDPEEWN